MKFWPLMQIVWLCLYVVFCLFYRTENRYQVCWLGCERPRPISKGNNGWNHISGEVNWMGTNINQSRSIYQFKQCSLWQNITLQICFLGHYMWASFPTVILSINKTMFSVLLVCSFLFSNTSQKRINRSQLTPQKLRVACQGASD